MACTLLCMWSIYRKECTKRLRSGVQEVSQYVGDIVKDDMVSVRPLIVRDEQLKSRMRSYSQMMMNPGKDNKEKE